MKTRGQVMVLLLVAAVTLVCFLSPDLARGQIRVYPTTTINSSTSQAIDMSQAIDSARYSQPVTIVDQTAANTGSVFPADGSTLGATTDFSNLILPARRDTFFISFFTNANNPNLQDGQMFITNPGVSAADICADIYVFTPDGRMSECCSCPVRANSLLTLSINQDLTDNPAAGLPPTKGVFKVISSLPTLVTSSFCPLQACDPRHPQPAPALVGFNELVNLGDIKGESTDKDHKDWVAVALSTAELTKLQNQCNLIFTYGGGRGICTCGFGQ